MLVSYSEIMKQSRAAIKNAKLDIHAKLMQSYKQVPQWWFLILLLGSAVVSLMMSFVWKDEVQLPWWGMIFAFGLAFIVTLPIGVIQATTNQVKIEVLVTRSLLSMFFNARFALLTCCFSICFSFAATRIRHHCAVPYRVCAPRKTHCESAFQDLRTDQHHSCSLFLI